MGRPLKSKGFYQRGNHPPPKHFTEDLLLSAMEHASAAEFAEIGDVERTGLGTPATRAGVLGEVGAWRFSGTQRQTASAHEKGL